MDSAARLCLFCRRNTCCRRIRTDVSCKTAFSSVHPSEWISGVESTANNITRRVPRQQNEVFPNGSPKVKADAEAKQAAAKAPELHIPPSFSPRERAVNRSECQKKSTQQDRGMLSPEPVAYACLIDRARSTGSRWSAGTSASTDSLPSPTYRSGAGSARGATETPRCR